MKIRTGFVSNSSSSSFCIYGISIDLNELEETLFEQFPSDEEVKKIQDLKKSEDYEDYDVYEEVVELTIKKLQIIDDRFAYVGDYEDETTYIGIDPFCVKDDETGKQFRNKVWDGLFEVLKIPSDKCGDQEGVIYG